MSLARSLHEMRRPIALLGFCLLCACERSGAGESSASVALRSESWPVCTLLGPSANRPGVYGSDLGFSAVKPVAGGAPSELALLFGDTWAGNADVCTYPVIHSDDLEASLPLQRPAALAPSAPAAAAASACDALSYPVDQSNVPVRFVAMRLFPDAGQRDDSRLIDMSMLRTPAAAFSDGTTLFGMFVRQELATCSDASACPRGMSCSTDPSYQGRSVGACQPQVGLTDDAAPVLCLSDVGCAPPSQCGALSSGVCLANAAFAEPGAAPPSWYSDDPRRAVAQTIYIASAFWSDSSQDFATGYRFVTNRFTNLATRTIANFDLLHPENNDYSPGNQSLLLWGRPAWLGQGGFQSLMFLAVQPLAGMLDAQGVIHWAPKYFAGYGADGSPQWSDAEADALPVYGADDYDAKPEFDYVNQFSTVWVEALSRWVMIYGGSSPAWLAVDKATGVLAPVSHAQPSAGSMYLRTARHPWGRTRAAAPADEAWSAPQLLLERASVKQYLACADDPAKQLPCGVASDANRPADLVSAIDMLSAASSATDAIEVAAKCLGGSLALGTQYSLADDSGGHLYGANIIESWSQDVTSQVSDLASGQRAIELYWNVSTWNPYQVLLMKSQLRGTPASD
jgi:hypothetical protein